jgi:hypothetical protein
MATGAHTTPSSSRRGHSRPFPSSSKTSARRSLRRTPTSSIAWAEQEYNCCSLPVEAIIVRPSLDDVWEGDVVATTSGGRVIRLAIRVTQVQRGDSAIDYQLIASDDGVPVISKSQPGCSFVYAKTGYGSSDPEVKDLRLYIDAPKRGLGYGFVVVSFIKAFFFPFRTKATPLGRSRFAHLILRLTSQATLSSPLAGCAMGFIAYLSSHRRMLQSFIRNRDSRFVLVAFQLNSCRI